MLVQERADTLRLIRQPDHARLAAELALQWRPGDGGRVPLAALAATALHDSMWWEEDRLPRLDRRTGRPHDFTTMPADRRRHLVESGLKALGAFDPEYAALVRAHHAALAGTLPVDPASDLAWVRFFDTLSLRICLTPPDVRAEGVPPWLETVPLRSPGGPAFVLGWSSPDRVRLVPFPLGPGPLRLSVPYRDLPASRWDSDEALEAAWRAAPAGLWEVEIAP